MLSVFTAVATRAQTPLATAFTCQGELAISGSAVSGTSDLRCRLCDSPSAGDHTGSTLCSDNPAVSLVRFEVSLDFEAVFARQKWFLEIEVRQDTGHDCSDATGYSLLSPRQELTASPKATFAETAASAVAASLGSLGFPHTTALCGTLGTASGRQWRSQH